MKSKSDTKKKKFKKPEVKSEKIIEAGLGASCNGSSNGGRKGSSGEGCHAGSFLS